MVGTGRVGSGTGPLGNQDYGIDTRKQTRIGGRGAGFGTSQEVSIWVLDKNGK